MPTYKLNKGFLLFFIILIGYPALGNAIVHGQENATWAGSKFLRGFDPSSHKALSDRGIKEFSSRIQENHIKYVYMFAGPYQKGGGLPLYAFSEIARRNLLKIKKDNPNLRILAWIGGVQGITVHFERDQWFANCLESTEKLLKEMPFDGVHIDFEFIRFPSPSSGMHLDNYKKKWLKFFEALRNNLPNGLISTAIVSTSPEIQPWKEPPSIEELEKLCAWVDQVVVMFYDTGIHSMPVYEMAMNTQLRQIEILKKKFEVKSPQFLFGIGAYQNPSPLQKFRDQFLEAPSRTVPLLLSSLKKIGDSKILDGIALYSDWTAEEKDWAALRFWGANFAPN